MAAAKITITHKVSWVPSGGDSIVLQGQESKSQVGGDASEQTQNFTSTTSAVKIGQCTGAKYLFVKNLAEKADTGNAVADAATDVLNTLGVDIVTPVVISAAQIKLPPGKSVGIYTAQDTWYGITGGNTVPAVVGAVEE